MFFCDQGCLTVEQAQFFRVQAAFFSKQALFFREEATQNDDQARVWHGTAWIHPVQALLFCDQSL